MSDIRPAIKPWLDWALNNTNHITYSEAGNRASAIGVWPPKLPVAADCSMFLTWIYWLAGAEHDPTNAAGFATHEGYTGTELSVGTEIPLSEVQVGDAIVYGPGTGWHTAVIYEVGPDPLTVSHGGPNGPSLVRVSQDGRQPQRYLRFNTQGTPRFPADLEKKVMKPSPIAGLVKKLLGRKA